MTKTVFISRKLTPESIFLKTLSKEGWSVSGNSFIDFAPKKFILPNKIDWIFFYSKKGIQYFFQKEELPIGVCVAVIGESSAEALRSYNIEADFTGTGEPESTAQEFLKVSENEHVAFICAHHSRHSIRNLLQGKIAFTDVVAYYNMPVENPARQGESILVFTSPTNAEVYFKFHQLETHQSVIAIGKTTAQALNDLGFKDVKIASKPTEKALVATVVSASLNHRHRDDLSSTR